MKRTRDGLTVSMEKEKKSGLRVRAPLPGTVKIRSGTLANSGMSKRWCDIGNPASG